MVEKKDYFVRAVTTLLGLRPSSTPLPSQPATGLQARKPPIENGGLIGRLVIPRLQLHAIVREGVGRDTLDLALGHIPGTALPGQTGNVGVAGHRDTLFRRLKDVRNGDLVQLQTLGGDYTYKVEATAIVEPKNIQVLNATGHPEITLVTCYPFDYVGAAPDRFIVRAHLVSGALSGQEAAGFEQSSTPPNQPHAVRSARPAEGSRPLPGITSVAFRVSESHSRQLAPGIWFGLSSTDTTRRSVNGWMWVMPNRRTIWLRDQQTHEPIVFYDDRDGKRRELILTGVTGDSVTGHLLVFGGAPATRASSSLHRASN
jgi:sortase A